MDLAMFSSMKVDELKSFLRLRGLKISGTKQELVARCFVAKENDVSIIKTAEEVQAEIAQEYSSKLKVGEETIPDPFRLDTGWLTEEESLKFWPMTLYPDIYNFLSFHPSELVSKDLSDYKTSKAYSYYTSGWLHPLKYNEVNQSSKVCLLRTVCRPSQKISDVPHKLWICLSKETGKVLAAHCSCMAGISATCNHVAAALFRVEAAIRMGLSNPSCTSKPCQWLPNNKVVKPLRVKDFKLSRGDFGRRGKKLQEPNCSPKKSFKPLEAEDKLTFSDVAATMKDACKEEESIFFTAVAKEVKQGSKKMLTELWTLDDHLKNSSNAESFLSSVAAYMPANSERIKNATLGQSDNPLWFSFRKHTITASKAHDVKTRMASLLKAKGNADLSAIIRTVSGESHLNPDIPALKYGRTMESDGVQAFKEAFCKTHKDVTITDCGLCICKEIPYVGGSPDRIVQCSCCGISCLEVKCPFSINHTSPTDENVKLPFLKKDKDGKLELNRNHKYYTQCQVQMAATQADTCYFFVWTAHGSVMDKVYFDVHYWTELKEVFKHFYEKYYVPSVFND